jgi:membrane protease subunit (stomatin/prohibitin family)
MVDIKGIGEGIKAGISGAVKAVKEEAPNLFIARPVDSKNLIIYKHPDTNVRLGSQITVDEDDVVVFFREGKVYGTLKAGRNTLDTQNIPFLTKLIEKVTGGNIFKAEIYFISKREFTNLSFGGPVGDIKDPESEIAVGLRVYGTYALKILDPVLLIVELVGKKSIVANEEITNWMQEQVTKSIKDFVGKLIVKKRWPLLDVISGAYTSEIEAACLQRVKEDASSYGIEIARLGNFALNMKEEDETSLKEFRKEAAYAKMAGGYQQYATGRMMIGAGKGMEKGGESGGTALSGAGLGMGLGTGLAIAEKIGKGERGIQIRCTKCGALASEDIKFCPNCGKKLIPTERKTFNKFKKPSKKKSSKKKR